MQVKSRYFVIRILRDEKATIIRDEIYELRKIAK